MRAISQDRLFNDSAYQKSKEKWCAAMMGLGYEKFISSCRVAVNDTAQRLDADFYLETKGREFPFQLVEVMEPGRRRGAEFKELTSGGLHSTTYEPERGHFEGPAWIADKIRQKREKNYAGAKELNVLVYVNFTARDLRHSDVTDAAHHYLDAFASVWVVSSLWLGSLHVANDLGPIEGWGQIFSIEEVNDRFDKHRAR